MTTGKRSSSTAPVSGDFFEAVSTACVMARGVPSASKYSCSRTWPEGRNNNPARPSSSTARTIVPRGTNCFSSRSRAVCNMPGVVASNVISLGASSFFRYWSFWPASPGLRRMDQNSPAGSTPLYVPLRGASWLRITVPSKRDINSADDSQRRFRSSIVQATILTSVRGGAPVIRMRTSSSARAGLGVMMIFSGMSDMGADS